MDEGVSYDDAETPFNSSAADTQAPAVSYTIYFLRKLESIAGAIFAFLIGFVILVFGGGFVALSSGTNDFYLLLSIYLPTAICEWAFLFYLKEALEKPAYPFAPWFAAGRRRWPILLRPFVALWWLAHMSIAVGGAIGLECVLLTSVFHSNPALSWFLVFPIISLTAAYSVNLFLLLMLSSHGTRSPILQVVWFWRIPIDLIIAVTSGICLHYMVKH